MSQIPKARTIEQHLEDFRKRRPNEPESLYALVREKLIEVRTDVTLEKAHRKAGNINAGGYIPEADEM